MEEQQSDKHEKYMRRCLELAAEAKARGNTPVGCVIVRGETIISEGMEGGEALPDIFAHAEALAILHAMQPLKQDLSDCILYSSVEPCFMCAYLIRQTKIGQVVFGITTPEVGGASSSYPFLTAKDIAKWPDPPVVVEGVLAKACIALFTKSKPYGN